MNSCNYYHLVICCELYSTLLVGHDDAIVSLHACLLAFALLLQLIYGRHTETATCIYHEPKLIVVNKVFCGRESYGAYVDC